jgi:hypothetical protein
MSTHHDDMTGAGEGRQAHGIQAEKPLPPWEQPGRFRLDCEPHRGRLLSRLATACVGMSIALAPVVLLLGLTIWCLARRDLAQMRRGLRDPSGSQLTTTAMNGAAVAIALSSVPGLPMWWVFVAVLCGFV